LTELQNAISWESGLGVLFGDHARNAAALIRMWERVAALHLKTLQNQADVEKARLELPSASPVVCFVVLPFRSAD
jgi:hypothetical protein